MDTYKISEMDIFQLSELQDLFERRLKKYNNYLGDVAIVGPEIAASMVEPALYRVLGLRNDAAKFLDKIDAEMNKRVIRLMEENKNV